ncbi:MAG: hypothetical protein ACLU4B_02570 [Bilophila wadsworthia]
MEQTLLNSETPIHSHCGYGKEVESVDEALQYALELCQAAEPHEQLMGAEPERKGNILAAPGLPAEQAEILRKGCEEKGLVFVEGGLREYAGGMEVGVAWAACGLAVGPGG